MPHAAHDSSVELLIRDAIAGDKQAFGRLYEIYADQIVRYIYFRTGEQAEAEDMAETVFLKAWENLPGFGRADRKMNFRAWLYRIAHNMVVDSYRSKKTEVALDNIPDQQVEDLPLGHLIEKDEQNKKLREALKQLDEQSQQVIMLRFLSGLSSKETAKIVGISDANVRVIQFRAVNKLRELMGEDDE